MKQYFGKEDASCFNFANNVHAVVPCKAFKKKGFTAGCLVLHAFFNKKPVFVILREWYFFYSFFLTKNLSFRRNAVIHTRQGCYLGSCHIITTLGFTSGPIPVELLHSLALAAFWNVCMWPLI